MKSFSYLRNFYIILLPMATIITLLVLLLSYEDPNFKLLYILPFYILLLIFLSLLNWIPVFKNRPVTVTLKGDYIIINNVSVSLSKIRYVKCYKRYQGRIIYYIYEMFFDDTVNKLFNIKSYKQHLFFMSNSHNIYNLFNAFKKPKYIEDKLLKYNIICC